MGQKGVPTKTLKLRGSWRAKTRPHEPHVAGIPEKPDTLAGSASECWDKLAPQLEDAGILTHLDGRLLASYCQAYADTVMLREMIENNGWFTLTTDGIMKASPIVAAMQDSFRRMNQTGSELGLSPTSRPKIEVQRKESKVVDKKDQFKRKA